MVNDSCRNARNDRFENPGFILAEVYSRGGPTRVDHFLDHLIRNPFKTRREEGGPLRPERAGCNLEGSPGSPFEGLGYSDSPCSTRLSVAGFLVKRGPFPLGRGFISEVRMPLFLRRDPCTVDVAGITAYWSPKTIRLVSAGEAIFQVPSSGDPYIPSLLAHSGKKEGSHHPWEAAFWHKNRKKPPKEASFLA